MARARIKVEVLPVRQRAQGGKTLCAVDKGRVSTIYSYHRKLIDVTTN
jgi:hypothetical protein